MKVTSEIFLTAKASLHEEDAESTEIFD